MGEPRVIFIMPLKFYREDFLSEALQSLQRQTCPDWSLLVVVEPSDHEHSEKLLSEDLRDPRITLAIMSGRGVGFLARHFIVARRFNSLGQQCVYRNKFDRWLKERFGIDARHSWRLPLRRV
jgi:hypothetical protein